MYTYTHIYQCQLSYIDFFKNQNLHNSMNNALCHIKFDIELKYGSIQLGHNRNYYLNFYKERI